MWEEEYRRLLNVRSSFTIPLIIYSYSTSIAHRRSYLFFGLRRFNRNVNNVPLRLGQRQRAALAEGHTSVSLGFEVKSQQNCQPNGPSSQETEKSEQESQQTKTKKRQQERQQTKTKKRQQMSQPNETVNYFNGNRASRSKLGRAGARTARYVSLKIEIFPQVAGRPV